MTDPKSNFSPDIIVRALLPQDIAQACERTGGEKAHRDALTLFVLGILAGAFIAFGAIFMTTILTESAMMPWGIARVLGGVAFSLGLILVIAGGAELFTGDALMIMAWLGKRITLFALLRAWLLIYLGNILGALSMVALLFLSRQYEFDHGMLGKLALDIASTKAALPTVQLFFLSLLCNVLVCLAVWMSFGARNLADKVLVIVPPIAAFVASGFEHSIANLYFLPLGLALKCWASNEFWAGLNLSPDAYPLLTMSNVLHNITVATVGNLIGGSVMVGLVYWFIYLRKKE